MSDTRAIRGSFHGVLDDSREPMQIQAVQIASARCPVTPIKALLSEWSKASDAIARSGIKRRQALDAARTINDKLSADRTR